MNLIARIAKIEQLAAPMDFAPYTVHLVTTDKDEAAAWQAIDVENIDNAGDRIRIIRLCPLEAR